MAHGALKDESATLTVLLPALQATIFQFSLSSPYDSACKLKCARRRMDNRLQICLCMNLIPRDGSQRFMAPQTSVRAHRWQSFSSISLLKTCLIGYAGFHPPRPGQDEDALSEPNVKNGYILAQAVSVSNSSPPHIARH